MTCHKIGRSPIWTIGLGVVSPASLILIPSLPQKSTTFIGLSSRWVVLAVRLWSSVAYRRFRDRSDEFSAPLADKRHLLHNLTFQVPRKNQEVIGPRFADFIGVVDRNVRAWCKSPLLVGVAIHGIVDEVLPSPTVIQ